MRQLEIFQTDRTHAEVSLPMVFAIQAASIAQEKAVSGWQDKAFNMLKSYAVTVPDFIAEDFRLWAENYGLESPREPRAYGALMIRAKRESVIRATGNYRCMRSEKSHGCPKMVWVGV